MKKSRIKLLVSLFLLLSIVMVLLTSCLHRQTDGFAPGVMSSNEGLFQQLSAMDNTEKADELDYYQSMFDNQFYISHILHVSPDRLLLAAFTEESLLVVDFDIAADSAIISFETPFASDSEGEIKTVTATAEGYALVTSRRVILIDNTFSLLREIPVKKSFGEYVSYVDVHPNGQELIYCDYEGLHTANIDFTKSRLVVKARSPQNGTMVCYSRWTEDGKKIRYSLCDSQWVLQTGIVDKNGGNNVTEAVVRLGENIGLV